MSVFIFSLNIFERGMIVLNIFWLFVGIGLYKFVDVRNNDDGDILLLLLLKGNDKTGICFMVRGVVGGLLLGENVLGFSFKNNWTFAAGFH